MIQTFRLASCARRLLCAVVAFAVETKSWLHAGQTDFEKGTLENLSLRSDGRLTLGARLPRTVRCHRPPIFGLWPAIRRATLYTGGGSPSARTPKLFAIDAAGKSRVVAELPGLQIQAIAIDKQDRVYAATAPDGKVYRVDASGKFDTSSTIPKRNTSGRWRSTAGAICSSPPATGRDSSG